MEAADPHLAKINVFLHKLGYYWYSCGSYYRARTDDQHYCFGVALLEEVTTYQLGSGNRLLQLEEATSLNYLKHWLHCLNERILPYICNHLGKPALAGIAAQLPGATLGKSRSAGSPGIPWPQQNYKRSRLNKLSQMTNKQTNKKKPAATCKMSWWKQSTLYASVPYLHSTKTLKFCTDCTYPKKHLLQK